MAAALAVGPDHGYALVLDLAPGPHLVCTYALNRAPLAGRGNRRLGCAAVAVAATPPRASIDRARRTPAGLDIGGWALADDPARPALIHAYVDGTLVDGFLAGSPRPDLAAVFGLGGAHGFARSIAGAPPGDELCVWSVDPAAQRGTLVDCRTID